MPPIFLIFLLCQQILFSKCFFPQEFSLGENIVKLPTAVGKDCVTFKKFGADFFSCCVGEREKNERRMVSAEIKAIQDKLSLNRISLRVYSLLTQFSTNASYVIY